MGLFDQALGALAGGLQSTEGGAAHPAIGAIMGLMQQQGGLSGFVQQLAGAGLQQQVQSWIGHGANLPIDGNSLMQALGGQAMGQIAQSMGLNSEQAAGTLASVLPQLVDSLTPNGQVEEHSNLLQQGASLLGGFFSKS